MLTVTDKWKQTYPGAFVGVLVLADVTNPPEHAVLNARKTAVESALRSQYADFDRPALRALPILQAYHRYYKQFKKTYHIQLQLESIVHKGKSIPRVAALVEAMFMAELEDQMLTAGHDLAVVEGPIRLDVADGSEEFVRINGRPQQLAAGDMVIADSVGVLSSVVHGPDQRTQIRASTTRVLFTAYAPPGIGATAVQAHLQNIESYARLIAPAARTETLAVFDSGN